MPVFTYTSRKADGSVLFGQIEAATLQIAQDTLKDMGILAEEMHEATMAEKAAAASDSGAALHPEWQSEQESSPLAFTDAVPSLAVSPVPPKKVSVMSYAPLVDTLRIYAGWLLAVLLACYGLGSYQLTKNPPFELPVVEALLGSPLLLQVAVSAFLFLALSSIHRFLKGGSVRGTALTVIGIAIFVLYRMNIE